MTRILMAASLLLASLPGLAAQAVLAGGCFWCMEADFEKLDGVRAVVSGYAGGELENPSYAQVASGRTSHVEAVRIDYDPQRISFDELLAHFWVNVDPTVDDRQFCDVGRHYRPVIFTLDATQQAAAERSRQALIEAGGPTPIKVTIEPVERFWEAEDYHQDYYRKNPIRYRFYRSGCGRDRRLEALWGDRAGG